MRETELKFAVHPSFVVQPDLLVDKGIGVRELPAQRLRATYYDVDDLRLARSGVTLRYRSGEGDGPAWTVKLPVSGSEIAREELTFEGDVDAIPPEALDIVTAFLRTGEPVAVATLITERRRWELADRGAQSLAIISDDEVTLMDKERVVARFREIEVETTGASETTLRAIGARLEDAGASASEPIPKAVRALGPRATSPPDVVVPGSIDADGPAAEAVRAAIARATQRLVSHDPYARLGNAEGVHQMRVAARRLRSDLKTFAPLIDSEWATASTEELRWIGDVLGGVRDLDVLQAGLTERAAGLEEQLKPLFAALAEQESAARTSMLTALRNERYKRLLDRLVAASSQPPVNDAGKLPAGNVLVPLVTPAYKRLRKAAAKLDDDSPPQRFHKVRIRAKQARYAAEAVAPAIGRVAKDARRFAKRAAAVQDHLGEHQDANVAIEAIEKVALDMQEDVPFQIAVGRIIERETASAAELRTTWRRDWSQLDDKKTTKWLET